MKKINFFELSFHAIGFVGALFGIFALYDKGFTTYCWPLYCAIWILVSYIKTLTILKLENKK
jgi:hypothetical protein